jgi:hypothetical protein
MVRQIAHPGAVSPPVSPAGRGETRGKTEEPEQEPEPENISDAVQAAGRTETADTPEERPTSAMSARELVKWAEQLSSRSPTGRLASALKEAAESPPKEYGNTEERLEALALKTVAAVSQGAGAVHRQLEHEMVQTPATKLSLKPADPAADVPKPDVPKPDAATADQPHTSTYQPSVSDDQSLQQAPAGEALSMDAAGKTTKRSSKPKPANKRTTPAIESEVLVGATPDTSTPISRKLRRPDPALGLSNLDKDGKTVKPCRFGIQCTREACWFSHPEGYTPPPPGSDDLRGAQRRAETLKNKKKLKQEGEAEEKDAGHENEPAGSIQSAQQRKERAQKMPRKKVKQQRSGKGKRNADDENFVVNLPSGNQVSVGRAVMDARSTSITPPNSASTERGTGTGRGKGKGIGGASKSDGRQPAAKATREILEHFICEWVNSRGGEVALDELVDTLGSAKAGGTTYAASAKYWTKQPTVAKAVLAIVETSTLFETGGDKDSRGKDKRFNAKKERQNENQCKSHYRRQNKHRNKPESQGGVQHLESGGRQYQ